MYSYFCKYPMENETVDQFIARRVQGLREIHKAQEHRKAKHRLFYKPKQFVLTKDITNQIMDDVYQYIWEGRFAYGRN